MNSEFKKGRESRKLSGGVEGRVVEEVGVDMKSHYEEEVRA